MFRREPHCKMRVQDGTSPSLKAFAAKKLPIFNVCRWLLQLNGNVNGL